MIGISGYMAIGISPLTGSASNANLSLRITLSLPSEALIQLAVDCGLKLPDEFSNTLSTAERLAVIKQIIERSCHTSRYSLLNGPVEEKYKKLARIIEN